MPVSDSSHSPKPKAVISWSGGKDSLLCLHKALSEQRYEIAWLLTTVSGATGRVATHEVRAELIERQAERLGIPLVKMVMSDEPQSGDYERNLLGNLDRLKAQGLEVCIFGDLFLADIRVYREKLLEGSGLRPVFPLWDLPTDQLARQSIELGFKARLVCVNEQYLDRKFAGRQFDTRLLADLPENVDPCGENGEFHSFVWDGPLFSAPIEIRTGAVEHRVRAHPGLAETSGYWLCDLEPLGEAVPVRSAS